MAFLPAKYRVPPGADLTLDDCKSFASRYENAGYPTPKYLEFCQYCIEAGYKVTLYDARTTVSKYVFVFGKDRVFKVRFSNHAPNKYKEKYDDCFFVGKANYNITTTRDAKIAMERFFNEPV